MTLKFNLGIIFVMNVFTIRHNIGDVELQTDTLAQQLGAICWNYLYVFQVYNLHDTLTEATAAINLLSKRIAP